jgi:hypothetical protein
MNGTIYDLLERKFGQYKLTNRSDEIRFNCPECQDRKYHLYINIEKLLFNCYRCEFRGSLNKIFGNKILPKPKRKKVKPLVSTVINTEPFTPLTQNDSKIAKRAAEYLRTRNIYDHRELLLGVKDQWLGRIVFPVYEKGNMVFGSGRSIIGQKPKYLNTEGTKGQHIYRLEAMSFSPSIVICEGAIDALSVPGGVAIFGKVLSKHQFAKLRKTLQRSTHIYVGLDHDAKKEAVDLCGVLSTYFNKVSLVMIPEGEDLNSMLVSGSLRTVRTTPISDLSLLELNSEYI